MRLATIIFVALLLLGASLIKKQHMQQDGSPVIEVVMFDEAGEKVVGTALLPLSLMDEYNHIGFYEGIAPPPGTDFDILPVPMKDGGEVYMLCVK